eukprot:TRINITY_DN8396_c0_g1_i1.p1 TRINITY_DN8396_c0_g1~~TRINITY_DN8396_c0_g1_i1.p1  ORF type:complete len:108 (+),score=20.29 TRINITY_DN8396_c0_g1_i1:105-428(+)
MIDEDINDRRKCKYREQSNLNEDGVEIININRDNDQEDMNEETTARTNIVRQQDERGRLRVPERQEAGHQVLEVLGQAAYEAFMQETEPVRLRVPSRHEAGQQVLET